MLIREQETEDSSAWILVVGNTHVGLKPLQILLYTLLGKSPIIFAILIVAEIQAELCSHVVSPTKNNIGCNSVTKTCTWTSMVSHS